jgi:hypothetical protein
MKIVAPTLVEVLQRDDQLLEAGRLRDPRRVAKYLGQTVGRLSR